MTLPSGIRRWIGPVLAVVAVTIALFLVGRTLGRYSLAEIGQSVATVPGTRLAAAAAFAAASYFCLTLFDTIAVRLAGGDLPYPRIALASFVSLSIGHNVGLAALSSGAVRYRYYRYWGLSAGQIARVIVLCGVTVGLGLATLGGIALATHPSLAEEVTGLGGAAVAVLAAACLALPLAYVAAAAVLRRPLRIRRWSIAVPPVRAALAQIAVGAANFACVAACLHQTLAAVAEVQYPAVAAVYVIANVSSILSHVPGGLGVIESVVLVLLRDESLIGALVLFRVVYYFVPLAIGVTLLLATEAIRRSRPGMATDGAGRRRTALAQEP
ncbi:MAG: lysylphosphatidylglycerol synthase domain-containing protein [Alphaproteobacteria bacterium]